jgi:CelD/BcsL family acetyltransferase involved in cellulose biosynthesis
MPNITLNAHFDGKSIVLDEPFELPGNARLLVTVVSTPMDADRAQWTDLAQSGLALAYGDNEPEYSLADVRRP